MVKRHTHKKAPNQSLQPRIIHNISCFILPALALLALNASTCPAEVAEPNLNELVSRLDIDTADINDVTAIFGEPMDYIWSNQLYTRDNLPRQYLARYLNGFKVWISQGRVKELRLKSANIGYLWRGGIEIGSWLDEVLEVAGRPAETIIGEVNEWVDGVLYKDINGQEGLCYYARRDLNVRFFFKDYKVTALYVTGDEPEPDG